jgi:hypothetical protein
MNKTPFFRLYAWKNDQKKIEDSVTYNHAEGDYDPVINFVQIQRTLNLSSPHEYTFSIDLSDPLGTGIRKSHYFEIYAGHTDTWTWADDLGTVPDSEHHSHDNKYLPWASGYVQDVQANPGSGSTLDITANSAIIQLATFHNLNNLLMPATTDNTNRQKAHSKGYKNVMDALNGINAPGTPALRGQRGILTGSGWRAIWWPQPQPDIKKTPGHNDSWQTAWEAVLKNVQLLATHYNLYFLDPPDNDPNDRKILFGPHGGDSGLDVWGGKPLQEKVESTSGHDSSAAEAQMKGLALIESVAYEDNMSDVVNLVWPIGNSHAGATTIDQFFPPIKDHEGHINSHDSAYQGPHGKHDYYYIWEHPAKNGRIYWKLRGSDTTAAIQHGNKKYIGQVHAFSDTPNSDGDPSVYQLLCSEQDDGNWAYGIMNEYSFGLYGLHETMLVDKHIGSQYLLLSACIGAITNNAEPVPSWTIAVRHPLTSELQIPRRVLPGQKLDVHYEGVVNRWVRFDANGDLEVGPELSYLKFPRKEDIGQKVNGITLFEQLYNRTNMITKIDEQWLEWGFRSIYTLGRGKFRGKHWANHIASQFEHHQHRHTVQHPGSHYRKKANIENVQYWFEGGAYADKTTHALHLPIGPGTADDPGGIVAVHVPADEEFFSEDHHITFSFKITDNRQTLDFHFCKPVTSPIDSLAVHNESSYGIIRFAGKKSGYRSGFYIKNPKKNNGSIDAQPIHVGHEIARSIRKEGILPNVNYTATVTMSAETYHCHLKYRHQEVQNNDNPNRNAPKQKGQKNNKVLAIYHDNNHYLDTTGTIAWNARGSYGEDIQVWSLDAHPVHHKHKHVMHESNTAPTRAEILTPVHPGNKSPSKASTGFGVRSYEYDDSGDEQSSKNYLSYVATHTVGHTRGDILKHAVHINEFALQNPVRAGDQQMVFSASVDPFLEHPGFPHGVLTEGMMLTFLDRRSDDDYTEDAVVHNLVESIYDGKPWITGVVFKEGLEHDHPAGIEVTFDPLEYGDTPAHRIRTAWIKDHDNRKTGFYKLLFPAALDNAQIGSAVAIAPDGSLKVKGKWLTDGNGDILNIAALAVSGENMALNLEHGGVVFFDAGEYNSKTQYVETYGPSGSRNRQIFTSDETLWHGDPSETNASWVSETTDSKRGVTDAILQLTADNSGNNTVVWRDTEIVGEPDPTVTKDTKGYVKVLVGEGVDTGTYAPVLEHVISHDLSIRLPVHYDPHIMQDSAPVMLGGHTQIAVLAKAADTSIQVTAPVSSIHVSDCPTEHDTWIIFPNSGNNAAQETVVVIGKDISTNSLLLASPLALDHDVNSYIVQTSTVINCQPLPLNHPQKTDDGKELDTENRINVDAISVGFYGYTKHDKSDKRWYRGWWGDPTWKPSYLSTDTASLKHIGAITLKEKDMYDWSGLSVKASDIGLYPKRLDEDSPSNGIQPHVTVIGTEIAIYASNDTLNNVETGRATLYFDAIDHGHTPKDHRKGGGANKPPLTGGPRTSNPKAGPEGHFNSDMFFWAEKTPHSDAYVARFPPLNPVHEDLRDEWRIHWEHDAVLPGETSNPGTITLHIGKASTTTDAWEVFAGPRADGSSGASSEEHLNIGIPAVPFYDSSLAYQRVNVGGTWNAITKTIDGGSLQGITNIDAIKGHYLVFNTYSQGFFVKDPGAEFGKSWIPGYSAGSAGSQTRGFAVVTEYFDWTAKMGGHSSVLQGPPPGLIKIGKLGKKPDSVTGEIVIYGHGPHVKNPSKKTRKGSSTRKHQAPHHPGKHNHQNIVYSLGGRGKGSNSSTQCTFHANLNHKALDGYIEVHDGKKIAHFNRLSVNATTNVYAPQSPAPNTAYNNYLTQVNASDYIVFNDGQYVDSSILPPGFTNFSPDMPTNPTQIFLSTLGKFYNAAGKFDPTKDEALGLYEIGRVSDEVDEYTQEYYLVGHHPGSHQTSGVHNAAKSHGRKHGADHKPEKHHYNHINFHFENTTSVMRDDGFQSYTADLVVSVPRGPKDSNGIPKTSKGTIETTNGKVIATYFNQGNDPYDDEIFRVTGVYAGNRIVFNYAPATEPNDGTILFSDLVTQDGLKLQDDLHETPITSDVFYPVTGIKSYFDPDTPFTNGDKYNSKGWGVIPAEADVDTDYLKHIIVVGKVGDTPDVHTGQLHLIGHHSNTQKSGGNHMQMGAVSRVHNNEHHHHRIHFENAVFKMVGGHDHTGNASNAKLKLVPHDVSQPVKVTDDVQDWLISSSITGSGSNHILISGFTSESPVIWPTDPSTSSRLQRADGAIVLMRVPSTRSNKNTPLGQSDFKVVHRNDTLLRDLTSARHHEWIKIGHLSHADPLTGNFVFHMYHPGSHENHSNNNQDNSVHRQTTHHSIASRGHFVNVVFRTSGGTNTPILNITPHSDGLMFFEIDAPASHGANRGQYQQRLTADGPGADAVGINTAIVFPSGYNPFFVGHGPAGWPAGGAQGAIVLYDFDTNSWHTVPAGQSHGQSIDIQPHWIKVGHLSRSPDKLTGNYIFHHYHAGSHENHGNNHQNNSHALPHDHKSKANRHIWHNMVFSIEGSDQYLANQTPLLLKWSVSGASGKLTEHNGAPIYTFFGTGTATGGNFLPGYTIAFNLRDSTGNAAFHGYPPQDQTIPIDAHVVGKISDTVDPTTKSFYIHGWHHGSHQNHGKHVAYKAISNPHILDNSITTRTVNGAGSVLLQRWIDLPDTGSSGGIIDMNIPFFSWPFPHTADKAIALSLYIGDIQTGQVYTTSVPYKHVHPFPAAANDNAIIDPAAMAAIENETSRHRFDTGLWTASSGVSSDPIRLWVRGIRTDAGAKHLAMDISYVMVDLSSQYPNAASKNKVRLFFNFIVSGVIA